MSAKTLILCKNGVSWAPNGAPLWAEGWALGRGLRPIRGP
jgi:hypothetical protein